MSPCLTSSHGFPLLTHQTQSPLRVQATVMIFSKFLSSSDSKVSSAHVFPLLTHQTQSPLRVDISVMIFSKFPSSSDSKFSSASVMVGSNCLRPLGLGFHIFLSYVFTRLTSSHTSDSKSSQGRSLHHDLL